MKQTQHTCTENQAPVEIELKLALPGTDASSLEQQLTKLALLAGQRATHEKLYNTYYDTPDDDLNRRRMALRIRRVGGPAKAVWLQTLKIGGAAHSALSQRGEWESAVEGNALSLDMLRDTPWVEHDPDNTFFQTLTPRFTTDFKRTRWSVQHPDGSTVEVALDLGQITVGPHHVPICELELELKAGEASALFRVATEIAQTMAVLPLGSSKAQRGFALASQTPEQALRSQAASLGREMAVPDAATLVLREMFCHFTTNLHAMVLSDDPEVVHQARVAWRRFKTGLKLFKNTALVQAAPTWQALQPLLMALGRLRDLEVANLETLPMLAHAYVGGSRKRAQHWRTLQLALTDAAARQLHLVRGALNDPTVGQTLIAMTQWLESSPSATTCAAAPLPQRKTTSLRKWGNQRMERWNENLTTALRKSGKPASRHRARILAKRLRYGTDALRSLLPKLRAQQWLRQASQLQSTLGAERDRLHALTIARELKAHDSLLKFLRASARTVGQAF